MKSKYSLKEIQHIQNQAEQGDAQAQFDLSLIYYGGRGVPEDYATSIKWLRCAAEQGHTDAEAALRYEVVRLCHEAEQGDAKSGYKLVLMYSNDGILQEYAELIERSLHYTAQQKEAEVPYSMGWMYYNGENNFPQDYTKAIECYRRAADLGYAPAQYNLGLMYGSGKGVAQDHAEAVKWYRRAAEQGHAEAQYNLGHAYSNGYGVPQNNSEGVKWYRCAADRGLANAQANLGVSYCKGEGVPQDYAEAVKWMRRAAEQGLDDAQYNLGVIYSEGEGIPLNYMEAYIWFSIVEAAGFKDATKSKNSVAKKLSPSALTAAQEEIKKRGGQIQSRIQSTP